MSADLQRIDPHQEKTWREIQADIDREMELRGFVSESYARCVRYRVEAEILRAKEELAKVKMDRRGRILEYGLYHLLYILGGWVLFGLLVALPIGLTISKIIQWR